MKILKKGRSLFTEKWRHTCSRCGCVFDFDNYDSRTDRDGEYIICPHCGAFISTIVAKGGKE